MADKSFWNDKKDKEWWSNFWYYYRFRIMLIALFLIFAAVGITQCASNVPPDLSVTYHGIIPIASATQDKLSQMFEQYTSDINGDGKNYVQFSYMSKTTDPDGQGNGIAASEHLMMEMAVGDSYLYILDRDSLDLYMIDSYFEDLSQITGGSEPVYGLPLEGNSLLAEAGFDPGKNVYACVRVFVDDREGKEQEIAKQKNAFNVLKALYDRK